MANRNATSTSGGGGVPSLDHQCAVMFITHRARDRPRWIN